MTAVVTHTWSGVNMSEAAALSRQPGPPGVGAYPGFTTGSREPDLPTSARWVFAPVATTNSAPLLRHPVGVERTEIHILVRERVEEGRPDEWLGRLHDLDGARVAGFVEAAPEVHP